MRKIEAPGTAVFSHKDYAAYTDFYHEQLGDCVGNWPVNRLVATMRNFRAAYEADIPLNKLTEKLRKTGLIGRDRRYNLMTEVTILMHNYLIDRESWNDLISQE
jgi:hypothetical protein